MCAGAGYISFRLLNLNKDEYPYLGDEKFNDQDFWLGLFEELEKKYISLCKEAGYVSIRLEELEKRDQYPSRLRQPKIYSLTRNNVCAC